MILRKLKKHWNNIVYTWCFVWGLPYHYDDEEYEQLAPPLEKVNAMWVDICEQSNSQFADDIVYGRISKVVKTLAALENDVVVDLMVLYYIETSKFRDRWLAAQAQLAQVRLYNKIKKNKNTFSEWYGIAGYVASRNKKYDPLISALNTVKSKKFV